ncbi:MAG: hemolysin family protein [Chloroflexi bacterium]|nr:hemolysin family protein [Chloroflexota bacterium]
MSSGAPGSGAPDARSGLAEECNVALDIVLLFILFLLNGVFAMSELAIASSRKTRLQQWADEGNPQAAAALRLSEHPNRFLATVQIGITLIGIVTGFYGGATLSEPVAHQLLRIPALAPYSQTIAVIVVVGSVTYLSLLVGELVPKRLALQSPERIAMLVAPPMNVLSRVAAPIVTVLGASSELILRLLGVRHVGDPPITEEEIELLLQEGTAAGVFDPAEHEMVEGIFDLGDREARELMTPRYRLVALDVDDPLEDSLRKMAESPHQVFPVYEGDLDRLLGMAPVKSLWAASLGGEPLDIRALTEPALIVPESMPAFEVLERFRDRSSYAAMVVDEYGGIQGLVTLSDLMEAITGDLAVSQERSGEVVRRADGSWLFDGALPVHEVRDVLEIDDPLPGEEDGDFETLGGFLMSRLERIPDVGDMTDWNGHRFEVIDMDGRRVDRVLVTMDAGGFESNAGSAV